MITDRQAVVATERKTLARVVLLSRGWLAHARQRFALPAITAGCTVVVVTGVLWFGMAEGWLPTPVSRSYVASTLPVAADAAASDTSSASTGEPQAGEVVLQEKGLANVAVAPIAVEPFQDVREAIGQVAYNEDHSTPVFSNYTGRVVNLIAKPGDNVDKGAVLFELDSTDLVNAESSYITAVAALNSARSHHELTRHALERAKVLFDAKAIAQRDYEQAQDDYQAAGSSETAALGTVGAARNVLRLYGKTKDSIDSLPATHRVDSVLAIRSPIAGTVVLRKVGPGQFILPDNQSPIYVVADLSTMWLRVNVAEADAPFVRVGQEVQVQIAALPGHTFKARIIYVAPSVDPTTRRLAVRAEIPNPERLLKPEMFASARILSEHRVESLAVPLDGVVRSGPSASVWVETSPSHFALRFVKLGLEQNGYAQILDGIKPTDRVVTRGAVFLSNAVAVEKP